jgi:hypothetical protein
MEQFKRAKIIMLFTEKTSDIALNIKRNTLYSILKSNIDYEYNKTINYFNWNKQHLYFLSNEDVKKNNWYIYKNSIFKSDDDSLIGNKECKKIIATTDTSLQITKNTSNPALYEYIQQGSVCSTYEDLLPQPSQQFIEKYIECYNKGKIIIDILVEYENVVQDKYGTQHIQSINDSKQYINTCKLISSNIKINPKNNTITIKSIKNSWNRKEVIKLLEEVRWQTIGNPTEFTKNFKNWIEQNL